MTSLAEWLLCCSHWWGPSTAALLQEMKVLMLLWDAEGCKRIGLLFVQLK